MSISPEFKPASPDQVLRLYDEVHNFATNDHMLHLIQQGEPFARVTQVPEAVANLTLPSAHQHQMSAEDVKDMDNFRLRFRAIGRGVLYDVVYDFVTRPDQDLDIERYTNFKILLDPRVSTGNISHYTTLQERLAHERAHNLLSVSEQEVLGLTEYLTGYNANH